MTVIWESFCILLSLQIGQEFNYWALTYHYTVVRQRLHRALDLHCSNAGLFTTENRQPDMVANKIKSTTTPVGFHGHIRHQSPMSRVSSAILSAGLLWSLPHTPQQQQASDINTSLGGHLLDMRSLLPEEKKKKLYLQAEIPLEVSLTALLSLWAVKGQNLQVGPFFSGEMEKIVLTLESPLFLFITGVRGPVIFIGHTADILISAVYFWLWCQPLQFSSQKKKGCDTSGWFV